MLQLGVLSFDDGADWRAQTDNAYTYLSLAARYHVGAEVSPWGLNT